MTEECVVEGCDRVVQIKSAQMCRRCNQARWRYGLTVEKYVEMWEPGNRKCGNTACRETKRLYIDHDHSCCRIGDHEKKTRVSCGWCVRGWLCQKCNTALGFVQDDITLLDGLGDYLRAYASRE